MRFCRRILPQVLCALALALPTFGADSGDVESARDYAGFPRQPGFVISDYDEDNPAEFDFPIARPLPDEADHVETVHVKGHRYVIRYEVGPTGHAVSVFQTQQYYEKLAANAGFTVEKNGAVGDVTETFHRTTGAHEIWVYLEPAVTASAVTIVESAAAPPPRLVAVQPAARVTVAVVSEPVSMPPPPPVLGYRSPTAVAPATPLTAPLNVVPSGPPLTPPADPNGDALFASLSTDGRVVVPFLFQPGKEELDASSQPQVDRVVAMMKRHPDLFLRIEGHTDNTGDPEDNMRLSAQRALAVQLMIMSAHIDPKRLDAVGVGGLQPLASNITAEGREKNRRIELVMWKKYPASHTPSSSSAKPGL